MCLLLDNKDLSYLILVIHDFNIGCESTHVIFFTCIYFLRWFYNLRPSFYFLTFLKEERYFLEPLRMRNQHSPWQRIVTWYIHRTIECYSYNNTNKLIFINIKCTWVQIKNHTVILIMIISLIVNNSMSVPFSLRYCVNKNSRLT